MTSLNTTKLNLTWGARRLLRGNSTSGTPGEGMQRTTRSALALTAAILLATFAVAGQSTPKPAAKTATKSPLEDAMHAMFDVHAFGQAEISPDGKRVAWVESLPGPGGAPSANSAIYVAELSAPDTPARISAGDGKGAYEEHDAAWSPDGKSIAFLSDAATQGQLQLFVTNSTGGG